MWQAKKTLIIVLIVLFAVGLGYWLIQTPAGALLGFDLHRQKAAEIPVFPGAKITEGADKDASIKRGGDVFVFYKVDQKVPRTEVQKFYQTELERLGWKQTFDTYLVQNNIIDYKKGSDEVIVALTCKQDGYSFADEVGDTCSKVSNLIITVVYFN